MIDEVAAPRRRWSWVGLASSLTMHALAIACVWLVTGTSVTDRVPDADVRTVRLVPGDRETATTRSPRGSSARPVAARPRIARPAVARPVTPPTVKSPQLPSVDLPQPAPPSPAVTPPEPAAVTPSTETIAASVPSPPIAEDPVAPPPADTQSAPPSAVDTALSAGLEDGRALPLGDPSLRSESLRLQEVTADATVAARAQAEPFLARREIFEFLLDNLEFATHVTRALRVARYRVWRAPEGLVLDDGWGALVHLSLVQATNGARVIYARGKYRQTLLPDIHGEAVMMIEYETTPAAGGREFVSAAVTSYVRVESAFMAVLMKLASAAVTDKAETESRRLVRTFARVSRAIDEDPAKVFDVVRRSPDVPQAELEAFRRLLRVP